MSRPITTEDRARHARYQRDYENKKQAAKGKVCAACARPIPRGEAKLTTWNGQILHFHEGCSSK